MTAVEWLIIELEKHYVKVDIKNTVAYQQAKEMEKQQIIDAWIVENNELQRLSAEQYYNKMYGGNK